jgi:uncharacterized protein (DUF433 family)
MVSPLTGKLINEDGAKGFLKGGRVRGCYFGMGVPASALFTVEGYATGATVHEATGHGNPVWTHRWAEGATAASVIQLRRDGLSAAEIATELGVNRSTVYRALKKAEAEEALTTGGEHG